MAGGTYTTPTTPKGTDTALIPFSPQNDIYQYLRYNTTINRMKVGTEYAQKNRETPDRTYKFSYLLNGVNTAKMKGLLFDPQTYYLPLWEQKQQYSGTISTGSTYIAANGIATEKYDLIADHYVLIWESVDIYELMTISSVTDATNRIDFTGTTSASYTNPLIIPAFKSIILGNPEWSETIYNDVLACVIDFRLLYSTEIDTFTPSETYDSIMVLLPPNYSDGIRHSGITDPKVIIMDNNLGEFSYYKNFSQGIHLLSWGMFASGRDDICEMVTKLNYFNGQQRSVWIPSMRKDFEPESNIGSTDTIIDCTHKNHSVIWGVTSLDRAVMLYYNGTYYFREISSIIEIDSDTERLTISATFGVDIDIEKDNYFICWLFKGCLSEDQVSIQHNNNEAKCIINFRELQA